jgi:diacylglycerol kinase (ATP)
VTVKRSISIIWSLNHAIEGIVYALRTQRNMRIHMALAAIVAVASLLLGVTRLQLLAVIFAIALVFITELVNTAVEAAVDISVDRFDPLAKVAKDVAAGAVLVSAVNALIVAYLVLFDPFRLALQQGLDTVTFAAPDLTVIALGIVVLAVLTLKAFSREGTWMQGGWPSGHAALSFAAASIIGYVTSNASALALALFVAFLVVQSRVEAEIHTILQSLVGALLGILLTTAVFQLFFL